MTRSSSSWTNLKILSGLIFASTNFSTNFDVKYLALRNNSFSDSKKVRVSEFVVPLSR